MSKFIYILFFFIATLCSLQAQTGSALSLGNTSDRVEIGAVIPAGTSYTKEAWIFAASSACDNVISSNQNVFWMSSGRLRAGNASNFSVVTDPTPFVLNVWTHVAVTYDAPTTTMKLYKNGLLIATNTSAPNYTSGLINIGKHAGGGCHFDGDMDEVRIWNYARCASEISSQKDCQLMGSEVGLLAYYDFNQGIVGGNNTATNTVIDRTGNGNTGSMPGFSLGGGTVSNWIDGTANGVTGTCSNALAEIDLTGLGNVITDGDITPSTTDDTDFGATSTFGNRAHTFTIDNSSGAGTLTVSTINITGTNAADFVVGGLVLPAAISAGNTATFTLTFTPGALGIRTATVTVNNDDCDEPIYDFSVQGTGEACNADLLREEALELDGTNEQIVVPNDPALNLRGDLTLEGWFNFSGTRNDWVRLIGKGDPTNRTYGLWYHHNSNQLLFQQYGPTTLNLSHTMSFNLNQWYHFAATRSGNTCTLYVNGVAVSTGNASSTPFTSTSPLRLGYGEIHTFLLGNMDEVRIWNTPRSAQELRENMHLTLDGCESGLVAYYQMNDGTGSGTLSDKTGNNHTGTLTNMDAATDWVTSSVNIGNDATNNSNSQTITSVPAGASTQTFAAANLSMRFFTHSGVEDFTATYQAFTPNATTGADGINIIQNPMWTVNKSTSTETQLVDYTFTFPAATFTNLDPTKYSLYWRTMHADGNWIKIATANSVTPTTATFGKLSLTGQLMVVQESEVLVSDVRGNMYNFDGVDDLIQTGIDAQPLAIPSTTWEAWVFVTNNTTHQHIFSTDDGGFDRFLAMRNGAFYIGVGTAWEGFVAPIINEWQHIAVVFEPTNTRFYLNGVEYVHGAAPTGGNTINTLVIGDYTTPNLFPFNGKMDEVRIWNTAKTQSELRENMHLTLKGNETGLISYYQFNNDDPVGTANGVKDATGTNNGTAQNMATTAYLASEVAVAGGNSDRVTISTSGVMNFPNTDIDINFGATHPNGEIVVYRLETEKPHGWESIGGDVDNEYFVVENFGANTSFAALNDITFNRLSYVSPLDIGQPQATTPLQIYKRGDNDFGATWGASLGGADNAVAGSNATISFNTANNLTSFSQIVLVNAGPNSDLPVELLNFDAQRLDPEQVQLNWSTASETNNQGFFIERMFDNETTFKEVGYRTGQGTTTLQTNYEFIDNNNFTGISYYRLRQVDFDGTITYSKIKAVAADKNTKFIDVTIYPNPVENELNIRFKELPKDIKTAEIQIIGTNGQLVYQFTTAITSYQTVGIKQIKDLTPAMYMLSIKLDNNTSIRQKFVKK